MYDAKKKKKKKRKKKKNFKEMILNSNVSASATKRALSKAFSVNTPPPPPPSLSVPHPPSPPPPPPPTPSQAKSVLTEVDNEPKNEVTANRVKPSDSLIIERLSRSVVDAPDAADTGPTVWKSPLLDGVSDALEVREVRLIASLLVSRLGEGQTLRSFLFIYIYINKYRRSLR